jgi:hypothetical protein
VTYLKLPIVTELLKIIASGSISDCSLNQQEQCLEMRFQSREGDREWLGLGRHGKCKQLTEWFNKQADIFGVLLKLHMNVL